MLEAKRRKWIWIGRVSCQQNAADPRAIAQTPGGKSGMGRLKETWRKSVEWEMMAFRWSWAR